MRAGHIGPPSFFRAKSRRKPAGKSPCGSRRTASPSTTRSTGRSARWIVLSNSLATNLGMWDEQAARLSKTHRVLRYDQRGHGGSDAPEGRYTFDLLMADALALMDALGVARAHFAGLSMGGATALGLALRHPDRLDR